MESLLLEFLKRERLTKLPTTMINERRFVRQDKDCRGYSVKKHTVNHQNLTPKEMRERAKGYVVTQGASVYNFSYSESEFSIHQSENKKGKEQVFQGRYS